MLKDSAGLWVTRVKVLLYSHAVILPVLHWWGPLYSDRNIWYQLKSGCYSVGVRAKETSHGYTQPHRALQKHWVTELPLKVGFTHAPCTCRLVLTLNSGQLVDIALWCMLYMHNYRALKVTSPCINLRSFYCIFWFIIAFCVTELPLKVGLTHANFDFDMELSHLKSSSKKTRV